MAPHFEGFSPKLDKWIAVPDTQHKCDPLLITKRARMVHQTMSDVAYQVREVGDTSGIPCSIAVPKSHYRQESNVTLRSA